MASASESYAVAAGLMMRSNVPEALTAIIEGFEKLDRQIKTTVEGFDKMASAAKKSADAIARSQTNAADTAARAQTNAADRASRAQTTAAERAGRAQANAADVAARAQARAAAAQQKIADDAARRMERDRDMAERMDFERDARLRRQAATQEAAANRQADRQRDMAERMDTDRDARLRRQAPSHGHVSAMDVSMAASETSSTLGELITSAGHAALEPAYIKDMLRRDNRVSAADAQGADDAAWAATRSAPGTTYGKNLEAVVDLKTVTGSLTDAVKVLPQFAQLSAILAVADKASGGDGNQAFAAAKAMEVLGQLTQERKNPTTGRIEQYIDPAQLPKRLEAMAKVAVATMGRVNPTDYLSFAKTARAGGMNLSDEFLYQKLPAMMMVMGASRAGTAIQSMAQVYQGGKLTNKSLQEMKELGLAGDAHEVTTGKGRNKRTEIRGKVYEQDLMATDPAAWAAKVHDHLVNDLHMSEMDATNSVQKFAQRSTIAGMLADLMKDAAGILKEQQNIQHTDVHGIAESNPEGKINALHASFENLMAALGGPMVGPATAMMDTLTAALNHVGDWARANPGEAKILGEVAVGLFSLAAAVAAISGALLVYGPIIAAARGLAAAPAVVAAAPGAVQALAPAVAAAAGTGVVATVATAAAVGAVGYMAVKGALKPTSVGDLRAQDLASAAASPRSIAAFGAPTDGFGPDGRPSVAPRPSDIPTKVQPTGTQDVRITNPGDLARGYQSNLGTALSRPPSGPTGFDSTGSVPSHPSTSTP